MILFSILLAMYANEPLHTWEQTICCWLADYADYVTAFLQAEFAENADIKTLKVGEVYWTQDMSIVQQAI